MSRKIITACMAVVALAAFALPASASAKEATLKENGVKLEPTTGECTGVKGTICITATNTDVASKLTDANGNAFAQCTKVSMTGYLVKNTPEAIEGTIHSASLTGTPGVTPTTAHCEAMGALTVTTNPATNGLHWCLRSTAAMAADEVQVRGGACTAAVRPIRLVLDIPPVECTYERAAAVVGTITTSPTAATLTVEKQEFPRVAGSFLCPAKLFLDLTLSLYTDNAEAKALEVVAGA